MDFIENPHMLLRCHLEPRHVEWVPGGVDVHFSRRTGVWIDGRICRMDWLEDLALRLVP